MNDRGTYRGIVLKESLLEETLPETAAAHLVETYPYRLDGKAMVTVFKLSVSSSAVQDVARALVQRLRPRGFFAQLTGHDEMLVVFPDRVMTVVCGQPTSADAARAVGVEFGIPLHQMRFEAMFENDHPNTKGK